MIKTLFRIFFMVILLLVVLTATKGQIKAVDTTQGDAAAKYGITFPIADLGNCGDLTACKAYCNIPENLQKCVDFAKQKGFYKEPPTNQTLDAAKNELGCDSKDACKTLCSLPENKDKCQKFAKTHNLTTNNQNPQNQQVLEKAKTTLGCDSYESCKTFCTQEVNKQKCSEFAKSVSLKGGIETKGPGGCTTKETCQQFCSDPNNFTACSQFAKEQGKQFEGPGNCKDENKCEEFCKTHQDECKKKLELEHQTPRPTPLGSPQNSQQPNGQNPEEFCKQNPDKCQNKSTFKLRQLFSDKPSPTSQNVRPSTSPEVHGTSTGPFGTAEGFFNFISSLF